MRGIWARGVGGARGSPGVSRSKMSRLVASAGMNTFARTRAGVSRAGKRVRVERVADQASYTRGLSGPRVMMAVGGSTVGQRVGATVGGGGGLSALPTLSVDGNFTASHTKCTRRASAPARQECACGVLPKPRCSFLQEETGLTPHVPARRPAVQLFSCSAQWNNRTAHLAARQGPRRRVGNARDAGVGADVVEVVHVVPGGGPPEEGDGQSGQGAIRASHRPNPDGKCAPPLHPRKAPILANTAAY